MVFGMFKTASGESFAPFFEVGFGAVVVDFDNFAFAGGNHGGTENNFLTAGFGTLLLLATCTTLSCKQSADTEDDDPEIAAHDDSLVGMPPEFRFF
jgi:hypothetical protein